MALAPKGYIPLDRRFERSSTADSFDHFADILSDREKPRDWAWLRKQSRVIALLAQAGSGKTVEFMHQVDEALRSGQDAFFFRIERLCADSVDLAHETADDRDRFNEWLGSERPATFYLDSVDEAKLPQSRSARPLNLALSRMGLALGSRIRRASFLVSCRSSEWFDDIEQQATEQLAGRLTAGIIDAEPVVVFNATFAPLDTDRVRRLAANRGGEEAITFLVDSEAIRDIVTPLDALLYLDTFDTFKGTPGLATMFASRGKLIETSVRHRLLEDGSESRRSQIEFTTALRSAQYLAFASTVAQTQDISVGEPRQASLDSKQLLASGHSALSPEGIRQLLACSLFVPSGQGRVRFYRREARDLLAAQWLSDRIGDGGSAWAVSELFIGTAFNTTRVPTVYGSMLAWLAAYDPVTRRRMIKSAPQWIIEGGDPRSLALEDRIAALDQHFKLGPHRFHGEFMFEVGELRRFARPELEQAIVSHLVTPPGDDLFDHLMQFLEAGRFSSAAPYLVAILQDFSRSAGDRMFAIRALIACGDASDLAAVAQHFISTGGPAAPAGELFATSRNDHFLIDLVTAAYPGTIGVQDALALFGQLRGKQYSQDAKALANWMKVRAPQSDLESWFVGLDRLCFDLSSGKHKPFGYDFPPLHVRAQTLLRGLLEIAARYIAEVPLRDVDRDMLIFDRIRHADHLGASFSMSRSGSPVPAGLAACLPYRRALYERLAAIDTSGHAIIGLWGHLERPDRHSDAYVEDLNWLIDRYRRAEESDRPDLSRTAIFMVSHLHGWHKWKTSLKIASAALSRRPAEWPIARQATIDPLLRPWRRYQIRRRYRREDPDSGLRALFRRALDATTMRIRIWRQTSALRTGEDAHLLAKLTLDSRVEPLSEAELIARVGTQRATVLVAGARAFARQYRPILRGRGIADTDLLALAGYLYSWNDDQSMPGIDPGAALRAALFFTTEWPAWATDLALAHPQAWQDLSVPLIADEIRNAIFDEHGLHGRFLPTISHLDERLRALISLPLFHAIASVRAIDANDVDRLVRVLKADPVTEAALPNFAARHSREAWYEGHSRRALKWMRYWAETDSAGWRALLAWMMADPSVVADGLHLYAGMFGEQPSSAVLPPLDIRYAFAQLAFSHIRVEDDAPTKEGVHSVTVRDDLQHLRSSIGELLGVDFDAAERAALEDILSRYISPISPAWASNWRNRYEQRAVSPRAWSHDKIIETADNLASAPGTGDELYARVGTMIAELEKELAKSEFDRRGLFSTSILEADFRAWLGHALDSRRRPWFSIVQEAETASATRTDLRIELRSTGNAVVVIELKLFHAWTYEELLDKFRSQLVDQYLLTPRVRHGIYLLVDLGRKAKGSMPDGSTPTAQELVDLINAGAADMAKQGGPIAKAQSFVVQRTKRNAKRDGEIGDAAAAGPQPHVAASGTPKPKGRGRQKTSRTALGLAEPAPAPDEAADTTG